MSAPDLRTVRVIRKQHISPGFIRVTLGGDELKGFPEGNEGGHLKLLFFQGTEPQKAMRTYTIRYHRPELNELDIDFVFHAGDGYASRWAQQCQIGDPLTIRGPGDKKYFNPNADWFLLAGDMTALPAAAAMLEALPKDARGYAIFEVRSEADRLPLSLPQGIELIWRINPDSERDSEGLLEAIKAVQWLQGEPYVFAAGENSITRKIRRYLLCERELSRQKIYVSSYWKIGMQEEQHKLHKKGDEQL